MPTDESVEAPDFGAVIAELRRQVHSAGRKARPELKEQLARVLNARAVSWANHASAAIDQAVANSQPVYDVGRRSGSTMQEDVRGSVRGVRNAFRVLEPKLPDWVQCDRCSRQATRSVAGVPVCDKHVGDVQRDIHSNVQLDSTTRTLIAAAEADLVEATRLDPSYSDARSNPVPLAA